MRLARPRLGKSFNSVTPLYNASTTARAAAGLPLRCMPRNALKVCKGAERPADIYYIRLSSGWKRTRNAPSHFVVGQGFAAIQFPVAQRDGGGKTGFALFPQQHREKE